MKTSARRRLIGLLLFLTVFFLPLHFHSATAAAQIAKECGCLYGSRTQSAPTTAYSSWFPVLGSEPVRIESHDLFDSLFGIKRHSRAPPFITPVF